MKIPFVYLILLMTLLANYACTAQKAPAKDDGVARPVTVHHSTRFCFDIGLCTEYRVIRFSKRMVKNRTKLDVKEYATENFSAVDPQTATDSTVVEQFMQSLRVYNLTANGAPGRQSRVKITKDLFFDGEEFKPLYRYDYDNGDFVEIHHLDSLGWAYDFKEKITEQLIDETYYRVTFDDYPGVEIRCNPSYYKQVLFNCNISLLSKRPRLTPCFLGLAPINVGN